MITSADLEAAYEKGRQILGDATNEEPPERKSQQYPVKGGYLSMSDALKCDRLNAYKYFGIQPSDERTYNGKAEAGIFLEGKIIEAISAGGISINGRGDRCRVSIHGVPIGGKLDGRITETKQILEIKTADERGFNINMKYGKPSPWHRPQVELYLRASMESSALIFYLCRDTGRATAFEVQPDDELWERIKSSIYRISSTPAPEDVDPKRIPLCQWCVYRTACWGDQA